MLGLIFALSGCLPGAERVDAPSSNAAITVTSAASDRPYGIECDGPPDEVALLGALCGTELRGYGDPSSAITNVDGYGMGTRIAPNDGGTGEAIYIFAEAPEASMSDVSYAAYVAVFGTRGGTVEDWVYAEPVSEGEVAHESWTFDACTANPWAADATLLWRSTTIRVRFLATGGGC